MLPFYRPVFSVAQTPLQFSEKIAGVVSSVYTQEKLWDEQLTACAKSKYFSSLSSYSLALFSFIDKRIFELKDMHDVTDSKALRQAGIALLKFEMTRVMKSFMPFDKLGNNPLQDDVNVVLANMDDYNKLSLDELKMFDIPGRHMPKRMALP